MLCMVDSMQAFSQPILESEVDIDIRTKGQVRSDCAASRGQCRLGPDDADLGFAVHLSFLAQLQVVLPSLGNSVGVCKGIDKQIFSSFARVRHCAEFFRGNDREWSLREVCANLRTPRLASMFSRNVALISAGVLLGRGMLSDLLAASMSAGTASISRRTASNACILFHFSLRSQHSCHWKSESMMTSIQGKVKA